MTRQPLPFAPLLAASGAVSASAFADQTGIDRRQVSRAVNEGLTWQIADRWAVAIGRLPCEIWGEQWWQACQEYCPNEHIYDDDNSRWDRNGKRHCRTCDRERSARQRASLALRAAS